MQFQPGCQGQKGAAKARVGSACRSYNAASCFFKICLQLWHKYKLSLGFGHNYYTVKKHFCCFLDFIFVLFLTQKYTYVSAYLMLH